MKRLIERVMLAFVGLFALAATAVLVWQIGWAAPRERCEAAHKWWDNSQRVCAQPILVSDVTGRLIDNPQAREEALRAIGRAPAKPAAAPAPAAKPHP